MNQPGMCDRTKFALFMDIKRLVRDRRSQSSPILLFIILVAVMIGLFPNNETTPVMAAQSTGDSLPSRTPTRQPTATATRLPTQQPTPESKVWIGRLVRNTLGYTKGDGSIFRVSVEGILGVPIELRSDDELITGVSGGKPEYGPFTAEFAPVTAGNWRVSVPALGISLSVQADNYNLAVIEFSQVPAAEATRLNLPSPTATPLAGQIWTGQLAAETWGIGASFSRLLVQVEGLSGHPVRLSTPAGEINTANTGQKPRELGVDVVEFTGLTPAKYIIEPLGLNVQFEVELKSNIESRVEFHPLPATATATSTPLPLPTWTPAPATATTTPAPPTLTPTATETPIRTQTPTPTETATPLPSPTAVTQWLGTIEERNDTGTEPAAIQVKVLGIEGLPIRLRAAGSDGAEKRCITGQGDQGQDTCLLQNLLPSQYIVAPEGLGASLPIAIFDHERVTITFDLEVLPAGIVGWEARVHKNTNEAIATSRAEGTIRVRMAGRAGQVVALRSARGTERFCEVVPNPVLGSLVCEFGQLPAGVYRVEAINTGSGQQLFVDGQGLVEIEFSPTATFATQALAQAPAIVGQGAEPRRLGPPPTATQIMIAAAPKPMVMPTTTAMPSPTPAFAWQGQIVETVENVAGAIGVRAAGLEDHPVILRSGSWQSPVQMTGTKPELGQYATEFGGLAQGEYIVELVDLAQLKVNLGPDQFLLVEFRYDFVYPVNSDR
jgi:hypothetical protein